MSKTSLVMITVPDHLVGRPVSEVLRVLAQPANRTLEVLAEQVHRNINNPDASLDLLIARMEAERKKLANTNR